MTTSPTCLQARLLAVLDYMAPLSASVRARIWATTAYAVLRANGDGVKLLGEIVERLEDAAREELNP